MVRNRIFWIIGEQSYFVYYPIISYQRIDVYRFETMDMGRYYWNNGVIGKFLIQFSPPLDKGGEEKFNLRKIARKKGASGIRTAILVHV